MHEDLNLKYRDIKPTLPFYYNLGRRVTAGLGARSLQDIRNPTCLGGLTEELDGMDEESFNVRNPALEFMIS